MTSKTAAQAAQPGVRGGQIDDGQMGDVGSNVNLFRGEVNLSLPLVQIAGRNGLGVSVSAFYASNVHSQTQTWNLAAPTGLLGVGWNLQFEKIVVADQQTGNSMDDAFYWVSGGSATRLYRIGESAGVVSYQLRTTPFWKITYDREAERWTILRDNGTRFTYGNLGEGSSDDGGAVEWGLHWGNWIGSTTRGDAQPYARAWGLAQVESYYGDRIRYAYESTRVPLGRGGALYTQSIRVRQITDVFGQTVVFHYGLKEPFEIQFPHVPPTSADDNAYQFDYETHFLERLEIKNASGQPLLDTFFDYAFLTLAPSSAGSAEGYEKRYLTRTRQLLANGSKIAEMTFDYEADENAANPGALRSITYPEGALVSYTYSQEVLGESTTAAEIASPGSDYVPRVWFGDGYLVVSWYSEGRAKLTLDVYKWIGLWVRWQDTRTADLALQDLQVVPSGEFFAVSYRDARTALFQLWLYRENPYRFGEWQAHEVELGHAFTEMSLAVGADFVAAHGAEGQELILEQWDGFDKRWQRATIDTGGAQQVALAAVSNLCLAAFYDPGELRFELYVADANREWRSGASQVLATDVDWEITSPQSFWAVGPSFAAATFATHRGEEELASTMVLLSWREDFTLDSFEVHDHTQPVDLDNPVLVSVVRGSLVGNAQFLYRYDGQTWNATTALQPSGENQYRYTYGSDIALATRRDRDVDFYQSFLFDPYQLQWGDGPMEGERHTGAGGDLLATPTSSGEYVTVDTTVYYRDATDHWIPIHTLPGHLDLSTVQNRAPGYIAYELSGNSTTRIEFFKDGRAHGSPVELEGKRIVTGLGEPGTSLAGPDAFVLYDDVDFNAAQNLYLYRITDHSLKAQQTAPVVTAVSIDSGYQRLDTHYGYDLLSARYDPFGQVTQFVQVGIYRGDAQGSEGYSEQIFFNALNPDVPGVDYPDTSPFTNVKEYFSVFNGEIYQRHDFDAAGRKVATTTNDLFCFDQAEGQPVYGAYVRLRRQVNDVELPLLAMDAPTGAAADASVDRATVTQLTETEYNAHGQPIRSITYNHNSEGQQEIVAEETLYAWEVYPGMAAASLFAPIAQSTIRDLGKDLITSRRVTTYTDGWRDGTPSVWAAHQQYLWNGTPGSEDFPFTQEESEPTGWIQVEEVVDINPYGQPLETANVDGLRQSRLYDRDNRFVVASFLNTSLAREEGTYYGFEVYEAAQAWELVVPPSGPGAAIDEGDAYTGTSRLRLPGNSLQPTGLRATLRPGDGSQRYVLSCWAKLVEPQGNEALGWEITLTSAADPADSVSGFVPISAGAAWSYFHTVIDPAQWGLADVAQMEFFVSNRHDGSEALVDDVFVVPFLGGCSAKVFDPYNQQVQAEVNHLGKARFLAYNRLFQPAVEADASGVPKSLTSSFYWRRSEVTFDPLVPNSSVRIHPRTGGRLHTFHHGEAWRETWEPVGEWTTLDQRLVYAGGKEGTLTLRDAATLSRFALQLHLAGEEPIVHPIGVRVADAFEVRWQAGQWQLLDLADPLQPVVASAPMPEMTARDWLLLTTAHSVLFYADDRLTLTHVFAQDILGAPELFVGDPLALSFLVVATEPLAQSAFLDNAGQVLQGQTLDDSRVITAATLYDRMGRDAVSTKAAARDGALFGYRPRFVETFDWATGELTGELAEAYPEDQGYPYQRRRFDASPLSRVVEIGMPGKLFAINEEAPETTHTTRLVYATNATSQLLPDLPAGEYLVETTIDPDGVAQSVLTEKTGRTLAVLRGDPATDPEGFSLTRNLFDDYGNLRQVLLPNAFAAGVENPEAFVQTLGCDFFGRLTEQQTPDISAPYRFIYDTAGRLRFMLDPNGAAEVYLLYCLYDAVGRLTEQGFCATAWDEAELEANADRRDWLPAAGTWQKRLVYDGDGVDADQIGKLVRSDVAGGPQETVEESWLYDRAGTVRSKQVRVTVGASAWNHAIDYAYDNQGTIERVVYDAGQAQPPLRVIYRFNALGQVDAVEGLEGAATSPVTYARFDYTANGDLRRETLTPAGTTAFSREYAYAPPGWLKTIDAAFCRESLDYTEGGYEGAGYYSGRIARTRYAAVSDGYDDAYRYDRLGRLAVAQNSIDSAASLGVGEPLTYDANGNFRRLDRGGEVAHYRYAAGSDRLLNTTGSDAQDYAYDANGQVIRALPRNLTQITYSRLTSQTVAIHQQVGEQQAVYSFLYDFTNRRVLKRGPEQSKRYVLGIGGDPLIEVSESTAEAATPGATTTYYLYGPGGLFGQLRNGERTYLLRDHLGSTRGLLQGDQLVATYDYLPLGGFRTLVDGSSGPLCDYLYTGQELDRELGLYNYKARFYDPDLGRFYAVDPIEQFTSPYLYAHNNPISYTDPEGTFALAATLFVGGLTLFGAWWGGFKSNSFEPNPLEWDWGSPETYLDIAFSALSFGMAGGAAAASARVVKGAMSLSKATTIIAKKVAPTVLMEGAEAVTLALDLPALSIAFSVGSLGMGVFSIGLSISDLSWALKIPKPPPLPNLGLKAPSLPSLALGDLLGPVSLKKIDPPTLPDLPNWARLDFEIRSFDLGSLKKVGAPHLPDLPNWSAFDLEIRNFDLGSLNKIPLPDVEVPSLGNFSFNFNLQPLKWGSALVGGVVSSGTSYYLTGSVVTSVVVPALTSSVLYNAVGTAGQWALNYAARNPVKTMQTVKQVNAWWGSARSWVGGA